MQAVMLTDTRGVGGENRPAVGVDGVGVRPGGTNREGRGVGVLLSTMLKRGGGCGEVLVTSSDGGEGMVAAAVGGMVGGMLTPGGNGCSGNRSGLPKEGVSSGGGGLDRPAGTGGGWCRNEMM